MDAERKSKAQYRLHRVALVPREAVGVLRIGPVFWWTGYSDEPVFWWTGIL